MSDFESRTGLDLMKEMVVSILVDIIREEMNGMDSSDLRESLLNEVDKFRAAIVKRMCMEESRNPLDTFKLERLPALFKRPGKRGRLAETRRDMRSLTNRDEKRCHTEPFWIP